MTSQQSVLQRKALPEKVDVPTPTPTDISPAVPTSVVYKLLGFTVAMVAVPIGSYFATVDTLFSGNSTFAGGLAAIMANVVLVAYVVVAIREDRMEKKMESKDQMKKSQ